MELQSVTSDSNESRVINATQGGLFDTEEETSPDKSESETDQPTNEADPKQKEILETLPGLCHHDLTFTRNEMALGSACFANY